MQCMNAIKVDRVAQFQGSWVLPKQRADFFISNIYSISLNPHVFGVFHPLLIAIVTFLPPHGGCLMLSGEIPPGAGPAWNFCNPELFYSCSQGWIQLTRGSAANPLGLHMCLFKCQWPTQAEYLLARACIKSKAQLQFIFIVQSTDPFIVVISVPLYLWYYSVSSEKLTSTLQCFFTARV